MHQHKQILIRREIDTLVYNIIVLNSTNGDRDYVYHHLAFELPNRISMAIKDWIAL
jgi:hypothetical protein